MYTFRNIRKSMNSIDNDMMSPHLSVLRYIISNPSMIYTFTVN